MTGHSMYLGCSIFSSKDTAISIQKVLGIPAILRSIYVAVTLQNVYFKDCSLINVFAGYHHKTYCESCTSSNGRNSDGKPKFLGPETTKIHRYLLVLWVAKSEPMFRLQEKEIDNLIYFTLYKLSKVADSFKDINPYHLPINYDRSKVAIKVYKSEGT
jgi:hypothetical protein